MHPALVGLLVSLVAVVPVVALALALRRRGRPPVGDYNDPLDREDPRFDGMNRQGLGWGTRDNDRGGL